MKKFLSDVGAISLGLIMALGFMAGYCVIADEIYKAKAKHDTASRAGEPEDTVERNYIELTVPRSSKDDHEVSSEPVLFGIPNEYPTP